MQDALRPEIAHSDDCPDCIITYSSSNSKIVRVDAVTGTLYGANTGSATVTASLEGGISASCRVTVRKAPTKVSLKISSSTLGVGDSAALSLGYSSGAYSYATALTSSDEGVACIDGLQVRAVGVGSTKLSARTYNGKSASLTVTVCPEPESIEFGGEAPLLGVGQSYAPDARVNAGSAGEVSFSIADGEAFASLSGATLTAIAPGEVLLSASTYNGVRAEQRVTIVPAPTALTLSADALALCVGERMEQPVVATQDSGALGGLRFRSSNSKVVSVNSTTGAIKGLRKGSATITVSTYNSVSAQYRVSVYYAPTKVKLSGRTRVGLGEDFTPALSATNKGAKTGAYTLTSNNPDVLLVDGHSVRAVGVGSAKLSARTYNGKSASLTVTVCPEPESIEFGGEAPLLGVGQSYAPDARVNAGSAGEVSFSIADGEAFASLSGATLTAIAPGEVLLSASTYNGVRAEQRVTIVPAPTALTLSADALALCVGERMEQPVVATQDSGALGGLRFRSSNSKVVSVNSTTGAIKGLRKGSATITVSTYNSVSAQYRVSVYYAPTKVKLSGRTRVGLGEDFTPALSATNKGAKTGAYTLTSNNPDVLLVDGHSVRAVGVGSAKLSARTYNGKSASLTVTVCPEPESISLPASVTIGVGQQTVLEAALNSGAAGAYSFSGSCEVAALSFDGILVGQAPGSCTVSVETYNGRRAECAVTVLPAPASLLLAEESLDIGLKEKREGALHVSLPEGCAGSYSFRSTNTRVLSIDSRTGKMTGVRTGTAYVYAVAYNGVQSPRCKVVVRNAPKSVKLSVPMRSFSVGQTQRAVVTLSSKSSGQWSLSSSDPETVAVGESGELYALREGSAKITVTTFNGKRASCDLTVAPAPSALEADVPGIYIGVGVDAQAAFHVNPGSYATLCYASSNPEIASVSESGTVRGVSEGRAVITATTQNGLQADVSVSVLPPPSEILPDFSDLTLRVGERMAVTFATVPDLIYSSFSYESSNSGVVRATPDGDIIGMKRGTATVTIRAQNGVCASMQVSVIGYNSERDVSVTAHRGGAGYSEENTMDAFRNAAEMGVKSVELDVRKTKDGQLVVYHNATIPSGKTTKKVADLTLNQLLKLNPNIPTLDEVMAYLSETDMEAMVELKVSGVERAVLECAEQNGMQERTTYGSFSSSVIQTIKKLRPESETIYIISNPTVFNDIVKNPSRLSFDAASVALGLLTEDAICSLHLSGKRVLAWTLNSIEEIQRAIEIGVDGVISDYPDLMKG